MAFCSSCGTENKTGVYCTSCGRLIESTSQDVLNSSISTPNRVSNRAMWAHLGPLLLLVTNWFLGTLLTGGSESIFQGDSIGFIQFNALVGLLPLLVLWVPGVILMVSSKSTDFDKRHGSESINNQISLFIYISVIIVLAFVFTLGAFSGGWETWLASIALVWLTATSVLGLLFLAQTVFSIMGIVAARSGREYRYPLAIRFLK